MEIKLEIALIDGTWLEGGGKLDTWDTLPTGISLENVHRSPKEPAGGPIPLAKRVFIPYSAILFIVIEK